MQRNLSWSHYSSTCFKNDTDKRTSNNLGLGKTLTQQHHSLMCHILSALGEVYFEELTGGVTLSDQPMFLRLPYPLLCVSFQSSQSRAFCSASSSSFSSFLSLSALSSSSGSPSTALRGMP